MRLTGNERAPALASANSAPHISGMTSLIHCTSQEVADLTTRSVQYFREGLVGHPLAGRCVGIWFQMSSTRTKTAFTVATVRLGGTPITFRRDDLQVVTGESDDDTARVMGLMLDGIVVRSTGSSNDLERLQARAGVPVINAMANDEHPTQGLCDLATLSLHLGSLSNRRVLYVGEGNNTASALVRAAALTPGLHVRLVVPPTYGLDDEAVQEADQHARTAGGSISQDNDVTSIDGDYDAVYTTRWQTTGTSKADPHWRRTFEPYRVDAALMERVPGAIFMHDLPAHRGDEVTGEVLDGPRSVAWDQARMKLYSAMAVLEYVLGSPNQK